MVTFNKAEIEELLERCSLLGAESLRRKIIQEIVIDSSTVDTAKLINIWGVRALSFKRKNGTSSPEMEILHSNLIRSNSSTIETVSIELKASDETYFLYLDGNKIIGLIQWF